MARRRKVGVDAVHLKRRQEVAFAKVGAEMEEDQMGHIEGLLGGLKSSLEKFAAKHRKAINSDPAFRMQFQSMCEAIGVDPLASNKGFWAQILGVGDFYYVLSVQVMETCIESRDANGGLVSLSELLQKLQERRSRLRQQKISEDDICRSIEKLQVLGTSFTLLRTRGRTMVLSVPRELSSDHEKLLDAAELAGGGLPCLSRLSDSLAWSEERTERAIMELLQGGMLWLDKQGRNSGHCYYFPSLFFANSLNES